MKSNELEGQISFTEWLYNEAKSGNTKIFGSTIHKPDIKTNGPDVEEWECWSADSKCVQFFHRENGKEEIVKVLTRGRELTEYVDAGHFPITTWAEAFIKYHNSPLTKRELVDCAKRGWDLKTLINKYGLENNATGYMLGVMIDGSMRVAKAEILREALCGEHRLKSIRELKNANNLTETSLKKLFGEGGFCGPDTVDAMYNSKGVTIDWHRSSTDNGIYPIRMNWTEVKKFYEGVD